MKGIEMQSPKFRLRSIVECCKRDGDPVEVEIEGVTQHIRYREPFYDVREVRSRIGYPASESSLRAKR